MTLNDLHTGDTAFVTRIRGRGAFRKRITEMGFTRGRPVKVLKSAPLKDPVEYRILDSNVSLRRSEASLIEVVTTNGDPRGEVIPFARLQEGIRHDQARIRAEKTIDVALVGNPNSGKTTLYNRVSRSREHVANYSGVTVESKQALFRYRGYTFRITDLPGTYSLSDYTSEERFVREHILTRKPDVVVNVVDANNLERNLYLTSQLIDMDITVVLALNMYDELMARNDELDIETLSELLGIRVVPTISHRGKGIYRLLNHVIRVFEGEDPSIRHVHINYGEELEDSVSRLQSLIRKNPAITDNYSSRFLSLKLLEGDRAVTGLLSGADNENEILEAAGAEAERIEQLFHDEPQSLVADGRYGFIAGALTETMKKSGRDPGFSRTQRIDRILTHKYLGFPIFLGFLWLMFHATFTLGNYPMGWIESGVDLAGDFLRTRMAGGVVRDMLVDGIVGGVGGVIVFLPNILILFFFISLMEDTGYMARTAFIMDRVMHLFGLHGKSFIPLIMGFGCNVPAIMATRTLENRNDRILTMLIIPFMSCSARLPVYVLVAGAVFPQQAGNVIFLLYMIGVLVSLLLSVLFKNTLFRNREAPFVMELPVYRNPGLKVITRHMWRKGAHYLKKMGGVILVASLIVWALGYFPRKTSFSTDYEELVNQQQQKIEVLREQLAASRENGTQAAEDGRQTPVENPHAQIERHRDNIEMLYTMKEAEKQEYSFIGRLGKTIEPVLRPLGFDWKMGISLLTGFAAKEIVVSTMGVLYQADQGPGTDPTVSLQSRLRDEVYTYGPRKGQRVFTPLTAFSFLLFVLLYLPCVAVIAAVGKESGSWKWAVFLLFYTTAIAWLASFAVYQAGQMLIIG